MTYHQYSTIDMGCIANSKGNIELLEAKLRERAWIHQYRHVTFIVQSSFLTSTMTLIVIITIYDVMSKRVVEKWIGIGLFLIEMINESWDDTFFLVQQFITQCLITVHSRLSTTSSLQFLPQETETPFIGRETLLVTKLKEKSSL